MATHSRESGVRQSGDRGPTPEERSRPDPAINRFKIARTLANDFGIECAIICRETVGFTRQGSGANLVTADDYFAPVRQLQVSETRQAADESSSIGKSPGKGTKAYRYGCGDATACADEPKSKFPFCHETSQFARKGGRVRLEKARAEGARPTWKRTSKTL